ncbi:cell division protein ZapE [Aliidiomarina sedimenti]|uniref:Cell division protein ZapE n=1 Tax=Aliidiomarina sedimenti TaxID=1933879 RepID=A0ABY0BX98_9GAMM|nr:cell division protein ZapE [Aliidiomarina sedimenti]RUO29025.1 cell division protein ZapE [Aliidiomarina sedimenti]
MNADSLTLDPAQEQVAQRLNHLRQRLEQQQECERGLYIEGPVGRGKSMLMNQFYQKLQCPAKIRLHYHHFMRRVHQALQQHAGKENPLRHVAIDWAANYRVLCLDEFMVEDIADAMLLGTLWTHLFALDVILVTTSNTAPDQLYRNGLQRDRFLPAIEQIKLHCEVVHLDGGSDYRLSEQTENPPYYWLQQSEQAFRQHVENLAAELSAPHTLEVLGRPLECRGSNEAVALFDFADLCDGPRSQRDYMELASRYRAIAVNQLPAFSYQAEKAIVHGVEESYQREHQETHFSKRDNEARRFIALVDECYDRQCLLLINAEKMPAELYQAKQLAVPFARCSSRLYEMQRWPLTLS